MNMYNYATCGLKDVWLLNGYEIIDDPEYGECVSIYDTAGLHKAIGHNIINNRPKLSGAEFRFLRKEMELSQQAVADLFGNDAQAVARWEKTGKVPKWADRLIRLLMQDYYGESGARALIDRIRDIDHLNNVKQVFVDENNIGWKKAA